MAPLLAVQVRVTAELAADAERLVGANGAETMEDELDEDAVDEELEELELDEVELVELEETDEEDDEEETEDNDEDDAPSSLPPPQAVSIATQPVSNSPRNAAKLGGYLNIIDFLRNATR